MTSMRGQRMFTIGRAVITGSAAVMTVMVIGACHSGHVQSALHPAGPGAVEIARLWWGMFVLLTAVFLGTMALMFTAILVKGRAAGGPPLGDTRFIVVSGIVMPAAVLVAMLLISLRATVALETPESDVTIHITGHQWWWQVEYPEHGITTANELYIPSGEPVQVVLRSADVVHSFWVPSLTGKMDMIPERTNRFWIQADVDGEFRGQCAEYCGIQHARMAFWVIAVPRPRYEQWLERRRGIVVEPETELQREGRDVFFSEKAGCHACHAIQSTDAVADIGPDLTDLGSRRSLGAGTLANTPQMLRRWTEDPQLFKPGNLMPATDIPESDMDALMEYLDILD